MLGAADAVPVWKEYGKPDCGSLENENLLNDVRQGRRSFPSGHTSMSFPIILFEFVFDVLFEMF